MLAVAIDNSLYAYFVNLITFQNHIYLVFCTPTQNLRYIGKNMALLNIMRNSTHFCLNSSLLFLSHIYYIHLFIYYTFLSVYLLFV